MVNSFSQTPNDLDELELLLDQALAYQADMAMRGRDFSLDSVLAQFGQLAERGEAVLAVLYNDYRLTPVKQRPSRQRELCEKFPSHAAALDRQIGFGQIVDSCLGDEGESQDTEDTLLEVDDAVKPQRERFNPLASIDQLGRFQIERLIGHGGMSSVYLALDTMIDRLVAIKIPRPRKGGKAHFDERCFQEARIAAKCDHPGLIDILEVGRWNDWFYLVSRYADRGDLATWIEDHPGPQPVEQVSRLMTAVAEAVAHCHSRGVLHLDLKPANLLFTTDDEGPQSDGIFPGKVQVADFGLARLSEFDTSDASTTKQFGTLLYMAPEQIEGDQTRINQTTDVFALGIIFYQLLVGHHPFEAPTPFGLMQRIYQGQFIGFEKGSTIPIELQKICQTCLAVDPQCRYQSAEELAEDLKRYQDGHAIAGLHESAFKKALRWCRKESRIKEAAIVAIFSHASIVLGLAFGLAIFLFVEFPFDVSRKEIAIDLGKLALFPHIPAMLTGLAVLSGRRNWQWLSTIIGACTVVMVLQAFVSFESPIRRYSGETFAFIITHVLVAGIVIVTFIPQVIAIPALISFNRRSKR
ncbi:serine/threonine protein kinase [Stieleria sp. JC731]|uniref:serine/threonine-protein kinase n=1 Tax=Pirellulaceae TaxID=2691357 RepID=UPI001E3C1B0D|nr:serine/threonine-protein kinase [Stieleria sp. JC731]MCC9599860.1 serine/threonine protein kinase [Stieleria sp. JC731]